MMRVAHIHRRPFPGSRSIESIFEFVRPSLLDEAIHAVKYEAPRFSKGLLPRAQNVRWAKRLESDVFHVTGDIHYVTLGLCAETTVLTIHDLEMLTRSQGIRRAILKKLWFDLPLRNVAAVTVVSEATKQRLLETVELDPEVVRVIPNFVNPLCQFREYRAPEATPRILHLGTKNNKNLLRTIQAVAEIECVLEIVGKLTAEQQNTLEEYGVEFGNYVDISNEKLLDLYYKCHVVCFASTEEGFGLPILEAQACGRPVVTSNCSSMPEVAGDAAHLVDPYDTDSIRDGLRMVLHDEDYRARLVKLGIANCKRFELASVTAQYADLYRQIHAQNAPL